MKVSAFVLWPVIIGAGIGCIIFVVRKYKDCDSVPLLNTTKQQPTLHQELDKGGLISAAKTTVDSRATPAPTIVPTRRANGQDLAALVARIQRDPGSTSSLSAIQKTRLEKRFAELIDLLQLSPEERSKFIEILSTREKVSFNSTLKLLEGKLTESERAASIKTVLDAHAEADSKIRDLLQGDASFATYQTYVATEAERQDVAKLKSNLEQSGKAITDAQASALVSLMHQQRQLIMPSDLKEELAKGDPQQVLSPEAITARRARVGLYQQAVLRQSSVVLTPDQLDVLRKQYAPKAQQLKK